MSKMELTLTYLEKLTSKLDAEEGAMERRDTGGQAEDGGGERTGHDSGSALQPSVSKKSNGFTDKTGRRYVAALVKTIRFAQGDTVLSMILEEKWEIKERRQQLNYATGSGAACATDDQDMRTPLAIENKESKV